MPAAVDEHLLQVFALELLFILVVRYDADSDARKGHEDENGPADGARYSIELPVEDEEVTLQCQHSTFFAEDLSRVHCLLQEKQIERDNVLHHLDDLASCLLRLDVEVGVHSAPAVSIREAQAYQARQ